MTFPDLEMTILKSHDFSRFSMTVRTLNTKESNMSFSGEYSQMWYFIQGEGRRVHWKLNERSRSGGGTTIHNLRCFCRRCHPEHTQQTACLDRGLIIFQRAAALSLRAVGEYQAQHSTSGLSGGGGRPEGLCMGDGLLPELSHTGSDRLFICGW